MTDEPSITLKYSCSSCDLQWREVPVRERGAEEDLADWIELVKSRIALDHTQVSPFCQSGEVALKIPIAHGGNVRVGDATRQ